MSKQSSIIGSTAIKWAMALAMLWVFPALGQEPANDYGPGATGGIDTHFTVTLDETTSFTITAGDSISAIIQAFSTQSLEINLSGWSGLESTHITVSGLPANVSLYKSDNDLRNRVVITTDAQGTCSWLQDVTESHNILIKPELSTLYLGDNGWESGSSGAGTWDSASKTMTLTENVADLIQIQGTGITLDGAGFTISSGDIYYVYLNRCTNVTVRNIVISELPSITGRGIYDNGGRSNLIENNEIDGLTNAIFAFDAAGTVIDGNTIDNTRSYGIAFYYRGGRTPPARDVQVSNNSILGCVAGMNITYRAFNTTSVVIKNNIVEARLYGMVTYFPAYSSEVPPALITNNSVRSTYRYALFLADGPYEVYNNNFISDAGVSPVIANNGWPQLVLSLTQCGGNYWSTWTGPDGNGDGIIDTPYIIAAGAIDNRPFLEPQVWGNNICGATAPLVAVTGIVSSDCDGPLSGVTVQLSGSGGESLSDTTAADGSFSFADLTSGNDYDVDVTLPADYVAVAPETGLLSLAGLTADAVADFGLGCLFDLSGTVVSDCQELLAGVTVGLDVGGDYFPVVTAEDGTYLFEDLRYQAAVEVSAVLPMGFHAILPADGHISLLISQDEFVDFQLGCVTTTGAARAMGYWKHQASVYLKGKGHAQETLTDMETTYPAAIFSHFHENGLNGIAVEGVTYIDTGGSHVPLDLATIESTMTVRGGAHILARAKQNYLAILLNMASGKLLPFNVISDDGRTASQAVQYIADLINDGIADNDAEAKMLGEALNDSQLLAAGTIPEDIANIAYRRGQGGLPQVVTLTQNSPNPFNPMTKIAFKLPAEQRVRMAVYAVDGRRVATLVDEVMAQGSHEVIWTGVNDQGRAVPSGVYFYRMDAGVFSQTNRMLLLK